MAQLLRPGTYVQVKTKRLFELEGRTSWWPEEYVAMVVGYDLGRTKYELAMRFAGWGGWGWMNGGSWAFLNEVTEISAEEALALPAREPEPAA